MMKAKKKIVSATKIRSTRSALPTTIIHQTARATKGTPIRRGMPNSSRAAASPANSLMVTDPLAMSAASIANTVHRMLNSSRMRSERPLPVTAPRRATISWTTIRLNVQRKITQRSS